MADSVVEVKCRECNLKLRFGVQCELCLSWFHMKCSKLEDCFEEGWKCQHCKETVNQRLLEQKDREMEDLKERLKIAEKKIAELTQKVTSLETRDASDPVNEGLKKIQDWPNSVVEVKCRECNLKLRYGVQCELCLSWFHMKCSKLEDCFQEGWKCLHCKETVNQRLLEENRELEDLKERLKIAEKKIAELTQEVSSLKIQVGESEKGMVFHSRVGTNVIISNDGRTIEKKNIYQWENGVAFTSRPLEYDELFEVSLDKRGSNRGYGFSIGVLTIKPEDYEFPDYAYYSPHAWMYYHDSIWNNGKEMRSNYGVNISNLPAGTRFGVMKKSSGDVHFFINGEDKGSAISGISGPIYGVVDLYFNAKKITILNP